MAALGTGSRPYRPADEAEVIGLWQRCGLTRPWNDPAKDIRRKLAEQPELFGVLPGEDGQVTGTVMAGYEGHRGWINYLAVDPSRQGQGLGRQLMDWAEARLRERGCPKINLQVRRGNEAVLAFYAALGYADDNVVSLGKRLEHDDR
jgi:ribosomal protein S18 acetylase RimI-like enzyme